MLRSVVVFAVFLLSFWKWPDAAGWDSAAPGNSTASAAPNDCVNDLLGPDDPDPGPRASGLA
jgi:hypothetical protein